MKTLINWFIEIRHMIKLASSPAYRKLIEAEDAWYAECEERDKRLAEEEKQEEASYQSWCSENQAKWIAEDEERYWAEQDRLQEEKYPWPADAEDCPFCGYSEAHCNCDEQAEDFSDLPCVDEDPPSPEIEYWNTRCTKCNMYPEFCWCGMEKLE